MKNYYRSAEVEQGFSKKAESIQNPAFKVRLKTEKPFFYAQKIISQVFAAAMPCT
jgi:hypothetical protein